MKIALPVFNGFVNEHFGHSEEFVVYTISPDKKVESVNPVASIEGCGCKSDIAAVLASDGVTVMLAGGIGGGAINVLNNSGIEVIRGCSGDATKVVQQYIAGLIEDSGSSCHQHESHKQDGHQCSHN